MEDRGFLNERSRAPVIKVCPWCEGKGKVKDLFAVQITCPVCNGKGKNVFTGPVRLCPTCQGSGASEEKSAFNERVRDKLCKGKGWIPREW